MTEAKNNLNNIRTLKQEIISFFKTVIILIAIAIVIRASILEAYKIPSGSMIPTLRIGDHILAWKLNYGLNIPFYKKRVLTWAYPKRGDVVIFTRPDDPLTVDYDESSINIVKRVIGLPGDIVELRNRQVFINGKPLKEPYAIWEEGGIEEGNFGPIKVPEDKVLLLGDNRDHSKDSRFWNDPFLPIERIKGKAWIVYWSWDSFSRIFKIIR